MLRLLSLLLVTFLFTCAFAAPHQVKKRSFTIPRVRQANYVPNGRYQLNKAYAKFGIPGLEFRAKKQPKPIVAASNTTGTAGTDNGNVTATGVQSDAEFLSPVTVGGQQMVMDFDTGSSDMYDMSINAYSCANIIG